MVASKTIYSLPCLAIFFLLAAGLGGCATTDETRLAQSQLHTPVPIMLMQSPIRIDTARLQKVFMPKSKKKLTASDQAIVQGVTHSRQHALAAMESALGKLPGLVVVTPPANAVQSIGKIRDADFDSVPPQATATNIRNSTGADAILRFGITDYGLTPHSWRKGYITFEVVTTLAIAAVIASVGTDIAKGAAGAYLVQETIEETAEGYAGFWAVDVVCRPVRIEAELIQLDPVKIIWKTSDTGLSDIRLSRLTRKVDSEERNRQLDQASDYAVKKVVTDLSEALAHLKPADKGLTPGKL